MKGKGRIPWNKGAEHTFETKLKIGLKSKDFVTALNNITKKYEYVSKEEFDNRDDLVGATKGIVTCKIKTTNEIIKVTKEEFDNRDDLVGVNYGLVHCIDKDGNKLTVTKEEFNNRDDLISKAKGKKLTKETLEKFKLRPISNYKIIEIYDNNHNLIIKGIFTKICRELNLPKNAFNKSYHNNGKPLYQNIDNGNLKILTENGNIKYKGWYAIQVSN